MAILLKEKHIIFEFQYQAFRQLKYFSYHEASSEQQRSGQPQDDDRSRRNRLPVHKMPIHSSPPHTADAERSHPLVILLTRPTLVAIGLRFLCLAGTGVAIGL